MLALGSVAVSTSAVPVPLVATSPGSLVLVASGQAITLGPSGVTAGETGPGFATIAAGQSVPLAQIGNVAQGGLFAVAGAAGVLSWFYGTETT